MNSLVCVPCDIFSCWLHINDKFDVWVSQYNQLYDEKKRTQADTDYNTSVAYEAKWGVFNAGWSNQIGFCINYGDNRFTWYRPTTSSCQIMHG